MKKVININFQGRVVPIEESAYDILKQYVESLRRFFANEEGRDEIINDIESRIAELFGEILKKGSTCITDDDVNQVIASMGRPEEFEGEESKVQSQLGSEQSTNQQQQTAPEQGMRRLYRDENNKVLGGVCAGFANYFGIDALIVRILAVVTIGVVLIPYLILWVALPSSASQVIGATRKRLFRDTENKVIAGVCSGLGHYFGVNAWIPRALFLIPFISFAFKWFSYGPFDLPHFVSFSFSPGATIIYIILWLVLPEAVSAADKLEMKGEKVDLNNIKQTVQGDLEGFRERAEKFGTEVKDKAVQFGQEVSERAKAAAPEVTAVAKKGSRGIAGVFVLLFKIFAYFIVGVVLFSIVVSLFAVATVFTSLLPIKTYLIREGSQSILVWGTLIFFVWVPVIGVITWIIRRIANIRKNGNTMAFAFTALWIIGWFFFVSLLASLSKDFRYRNIPVEETVVLSNAKVDKLELKTLPPTVYYGADDWFKLEPFASFDEDTVYVKNIRVRIIKSTTDSFRVTATKLAQGRTRNEADSRSSRIRFNLTQNDTLLMLDKGIAITPQEKFRNQRIVITVAVPVGKRIKIRESVGWGNDVRVDFGRGFDDGWNFDRNDEWNGYNSWRHDVEYVMTNDGLKRVDNKDDEDNSNADAVEEYRKSREQLEREIEEQRQELERKQNELKEKEKELVKPVDTIPAKKDVKEKYRYQRSTAAGYLNRKETVSYQHQENPMLERFTL